MYFVKVIIKHMTGVYNCLKLTYNFKGLKNTIEGNAHKIEALKVN